MKDIPFSSNEQWGFLVLRDGTRIALKASLAFLWEEEGGKRGMKTTTVVAAQVPPDVKARGPAPDRQLVDPVDWKTSEPARSLYVAADGSTIVLRAVPTQVFRLPRVGADGDPVFEVLSRMEAQIGGAAGGAASGEAAAPARGPARRRRRTGGR